VDFRSRVYFNFAAAVFIYRWRIPEGSHVSKRGGSNVAYGSQQPSPLQH
jgi:hypothetical protein